MGQSAIMGGGYILIRCSDKNYTLTVNGTLTSSQ